MSLVLDLLHGFVVELPLFLGLRFLHDGLVDFDLSIGPIAAFDKVVFDLAQEF